MYSVYAIYNPLAKKIYIGQTMDLKRRLEEHNGILDNPSHYTRQFEGQWLLIYSEEIETKTDALKREKQLKSYQGRLFVRKYIPG